MEWQRYYNWLLTALVLLLTGAVGCSKPEQKTSAARLNVVCTFLPVYVMTQNVVLGAPGVYVRSLLPPAVGCPHDYALTTTQQALLEKADVLIMNGLGMESFLSGNPTLQRSDLKIIDAAAVVDTLLGAPEHVRHQHSNSDHDGLTPNPHAWVSPFEAAKMTRFLALQLGQIDTLYASYYLANAQRYAAHLEAVGQLLKEEVALAPNKRLVTFHQAFDYLARDAGLEIVGVIETTPGVAPSARELTNLIGDIRESQPAAIFTEPQYSDRLAKTVSEATGIRIFLLDPATSGASGPNSYLEVMEANLATLKQALLPYGTPNQP